MRVSRGASALLLAAAGLLFCAGLARVLSMRLGGGDVYPPSSSHRADPLGTRALHDALAELRGISVVRNHAPLQRLEAGAGTALLLLGLEELPDETEPDGVALRRFVSGGGRLVLGLSAEESRVVLVPRKEPKPTPAPAPKGTPTPVPTPDAMRRSRGLLAAWGAHVVTHARGEGLKRFIARGTSTASELGLPHELAWHGTASFEVASGWSVLYVSGGYPVVVERRIGMGTAVVLSDSFPLSNEAMVKDRRPALLAHLLGSARRVVFDETHLGVAESEGVASLARRYRLTPFAFALAALGALFVWKSSASLLPRRGAEKGPDAVFGRDSFSGLVGLLSRAVPPKELPETLVREWERTAGERKALAPRLLETARSAPDPAAAYARLRRITERRGAS